jgi:hypothetical protein
VKRYAEEKSNLEQQVDVVTHQLAAMKTAHEADVMAVRQQLNEALVANASLRSEAVSAKENTEFAVKSQKAKEEELETLRTTSGNGVVASPASFVTFLWPREHACGGKKQPRVHHRSAS